MSGPTTFQKVKHLRKKVILFFRQSCEAMSFSVSEDGQVNASTLCSFDKFSGEPKILTLGESLEVSSNS